MSAEVAIKRRVAEAAHRIVKSSRPDVEGLGVLCGALGDLLGAWTGQRVRVLICADDQSEHIDMTKAPQRTTQ